MQPFKINIAITTEAAIALWKRYPPKSAVVLYVSGDPPIAGAPLDGALKI